MEHLLHGVDAPAPMNVTHLLVTSADYPGIHLFHKHYIYPLMPSLAHLLPLTGSTCRGCPLRTWLQQMQEDMGLPISACHFTTVDRWLWSLWCWSTAVSEWVSTNSRILQLTDCSSLTSIQQTYTINSYSRNNQQNNIIRQYNNTTYNKVKNISIANVSRVA